MASAPESVAELYIETALHADKVEQGAVQAERALERVEAAGSEAEKALAQVDTALDKVGSSGQRSAAGIEQAGQALQRAGQATTKARSELEQAATAIGGAAQSAKGTADAMAPMADRLDAVIRAMVASVGGSEALTTALRDLGSEAVRFGAITEDMSSGAMASIIRAAADEADVLAKVAEASRQATEAETQRLEAYQRIVNPLEAQVGALREELALKQAIAAGNIELAGAILQNRNARLQEEETTRRIAKLNADEAEQVKLIIAEKYKLKTAIEQTTVAAGSFKGQIQGLIEAMGGRAVLSIGAFTTAMVAMSAAAIRVSNDFREVVATIATTSGALTGQMAGVTREIESVVRATDIPLREVAAVGLEIARKGVDSLADFGAKLRLAGDLSRATGTSFSTVADGLQQIQNTFDLSAEGLGQVAAQLFAIARTGKPLDELMRSLQSAAPTLREFGIDADTAARALAGLIGRGSDARQAATRLKELAQGGADGADEIRRLANTVPAAEDAIGKLAIAVKDLNDQLGKDGRGARAEFDLFLKNLGDGMTWALTPVVKLTNAISDFFGVLDELESRKGDTSIGQRLARLYYGPQLGALPAPYTPPRGPLTTAAPLFAGLPRPTATPPRQPPQPVDTSSVRDAERSLDRLQALVDDLTRDLFPRATSALEDWQRALADEIATLEKGNKAQRERAEALKALGEQYAKIKDLLDDFTPAVVDSGIQGGRLEIKQINWQKQLADLKQKQAEQDAANADLVERRDAERLDHLIEQGRQIDAAVQGALDLASAFGLADENVIGILSSLSRVVTGIGPLQQALKAGSATDILGAALPVAGGIASIVSGIMNSLGESPELKAAKEAIERNVEALKENTRGLQSFNISGTKIAGSQSGLEQFFSEGLPRLQSRSRTSVEGVKRELDLFGLSLEDIEDLAREADLEFVDLTRETLPQFLEMLRQIGVRIEDIIAQGFFDNTHEGRRDRVRTEAAFTPEVEGIGEMLRKYIEAAIVDVPLLAAMFEGFNFDDLDSDDPAVRNAAIEIAKGIFKTIFDTVAGEGFDFAALGDFSPGEFKAWLEDMLGLIPDVMAVVDDEISAFQAKWNQFAADAGRSAGVFDLNAIEQAQQYVQFLSSQSPAIADFFAQFDLGTIEGLGAAWKAFQTEFSIFGKTSLHNATTMWKELGLDADQMAFIANILGDAFKYASSEAEQLAENQRRAAEEASRQAERNAAELRRRAEEEQRERERAHQEAIRRAQEERRIREELGSDTLRATKEGFGLFGVTDQDDQFAQIVAGYVSQAPVFRRLLTGDPRSAGDRAEMLQALRDFWVANPFGVTSGNLSQDAVRSGVLELGDLIQRLNEVDITTEGETQSFAINRSITELRGERLEGLLATGNVFLERIADAVEAIRNSFPSFPGLTAPTLALSASGGSNIYNITLHVGSSTVTATGLSSLAESDIRAFASRLSDYLGLSDLGA